MNATEPIVIVGAGHAGSQLAFSLRQAGHAGRIVLLDAHGHLPYQRPPLSKAYLTGKLTAQDLAFRPAAFYEEQDIERRVGEAVRIHRADRRLHLADGDAIAYGHLVLAMGGQARALPLPGAELAGVHALRTLDDARRLQPQLAATRRVLVVGAGFIGLEFAAVAVQQGLPVTVVEALARPMVRAVSPVVSAWVQEAHAAQGVQWRLGCSLAEVIARDGRVAGLRCADGTVLDGDLLVYGIGMLPHLDLARDAGLDVANGIVVDEYLSTSDVHISAIGDGAVFPCAYAGRAMRYESVQNAADQARHLAKRLAGAETLPYTACPWFWSDQGEMKLQIAGLPSLCDEFIAPTEGLVLGFAQGRLRAVETIDRPADHLMARRVLAAGKSPAPAEAHAPGFDFKSWARAA
ncbi:NAD(P)/FAD-dependent oxidoreductase [Pelomonas sp. KK5]|uniref:NAD(P)/FAD-dependent oxidoreductase n=1 Tax=Pelomonas sp. KK5 TaxID=1855730 RepID=UPI00097CA42A|nr:FAD-dependent oxidoreductase [Pelomonas sp. KK5]